MNGDNCAYVIGGGAIGLLSARELRLAGEEVTVLDAGKSGIASWAGGGILSPLCPWRYPEPVTALASWSQQRYPDIAQNLLDSTGIDVELTQSGLLTVGASDEGRAIEWGARVGARVELTDEIDAIEPAANPSLKRGLWMPDVAQIRNPRLLEALRQDLARRNVAIRKDVEVIGFTTQRGRLTGISTKNGEIRAERCLIAAGAWSSPLLERVGVTIPVRPVRGQMILFKGNPGLIRRIILREGTYVVPRRDGRVLAGSTLEEVGFDSSITARAAEQLRAAAIDLAPALADCPIEHHWAGLRPGSPDGIPFMGEHPEIRGLFVSSGHYRNGIVMGPASARLLSDLIRNVVPLLNPAPYQVACS